MTRVGLWQVRCLPRQRVHLWEEVVMHRNLLWAALLMLPLAVGGFLYAGVQAKTGTPNTDAAYVCPITGEELPCADCCPLN